MISSSPDYASGWLSKSNVAGVCDYSFFILAAAASDARSGIAIDPVGSDN
jgi:hypothetical protein